MRKRGFTLIELLVVISIIGMLSSVILAGLNGARVKARDAVRAQDMNNLFTALNLFYDTYGCLPVTYGGSCAGTIGTNYVEGNTDGDYGFDRSNTGNFMTFLANANIMTAPKDPINNSTYRYRYYCYKPGQEAWGRGLYLAYTKESNNAYIIHNTWNDNTICK